MRKLIVLVLVVLFSVQLGFAQSGCTDTGCQSIICTSAHGHQPGWSAVTQLGFSNDLGGGTQRCYLNCFVNVCRTNIAAKQDCNDPNNLGSIAHLDPLGQGILRIRDIRRGDFEKYAEQLDKLGSKVTFSALQEAIGKSHLAFAKSDMKVYSFD